MKKTIEQYFCDVCGVQADVQKINYPVVFHTEQTEERYTEPYISQKMIDVCGECLNAILRLDGWGSQGYNNYKKRSNCGAKMGGEA